ncbi:MAG: hypothetical protein KC731_08895, partial [Myxococcales bacterium]|nr:hypothetical protein [Myxococcales bacterium]
GANLGAHVYLRASISGGNPLFFRDPNALAGDNGTSDRVAGNVDPEFQSGFPILYDAFPGAVDFDGDPELGGGLGLRFLDGEGRDGLDLLGWYFQRQLADAVPIRGSLYEGDLDLLSDPFGGSLPASGKVRREAGINVEARFRSGRLFAQYCFQSIADLERKGGEVEAAWRFQFPALFALGDRPAINWVEPVARFSWIDNSFRPVAGFLAPSTAWDWKKMDVGLRIGIVRGVELSIEYSRNDAELLNGATLHPDELLSTLAVHL